MIIAETQNGRKEDEGKLFDRRKLQAQMVLKGLTGREVSEMLGIDESTFSRKMNNGNFTRSEIAKLIEILSLDDPMSIFFADDTA